MPATDQVLVTGTIAFDLVGRAARLPGPDESVRLDQLEEHYGGCGGNVARRLVALGVGARLASAVGPDFAGSEYAAALEDDGVDLSGLVRSDRLTARAMMFTDERDRQVIYYHRGASKDMDRLEPVPAALGHFAPGELPAYPALMAACDVATLDPGQETFHWPEPTLAACVEAADILFANEHELARIASAAGPVDRLVAGGIRAVFATKGADGCNLHTAEGSVHVPSPEVTAVDPTGAGDAHRAGVLAGLRWGWDLEDCARVGNVSASFAVEAMGAQSGIPDRGALVERYEGTYGGAPAIP